MTPRCSAALRIFLGVYLLTGCRPDAPQNPTPSTPEPPKAVLHVVRADTTDAPGPLELNGPDWRIATSLFVEENYPLAASDYAFRLAQGTYLAQVRGRVGVFDSRYNGTYMCVFSHNDCDSTKSKPASIWDRIGTVGPDRRMRWTYTDQEQKHAYRFEMNDLPRKIRVLAVPDTIRQTVDNLIRVESPDPRDSVVVQLLFMHPGELTRRRDIPFFNHAKSSLPVRVRNGELRLPSSYLKPFLAYFKHDLVNEKTYLNVSTIRQVIKQVGTEKVMITYQVSNWQPVVIR